MDEMSRKELFFNKIAIYFCAAIAIFFFVAGIYELQVYAAESLVEDIPYEEQYLKVSYFTNDYVNKTYKLATYDWSNPHTRIALYYGDFTDRILDPSNTNNVIESTGKGYRLCVLRNEESNFQYWYGKTTVTQYDRNLNATSYNEYENDYDIYLHHFEVVPSSNPNFKCIGEYMRSQNKVENLEIDTNIPIFTDWDCLREYLETGYYDPNGVVIDYSSLEVDDNMPVPTNFSVNKIYNSTNTDKFVYDYITWTNTNKEYSIQVDIGPVVYTYENKLFGFKYGKLLAFHDSTYLLEEILEPLTHQFTFEVFDPDDYYSTMDYIPSFMAYYKEIDAEYPAGTFTDYNNFNSVGYRFRYIDKSNLKAGPYVIVVPDRRNLGSYESYVLYSDGYFSIGEDSTGIYNKYENGNLDDMVADVDKEVIYKDKYETIDGDMDVTEATGWLKSVASFIKGTPDFVGSVMSFLPDPIRYGMYVCLFLGVIASGYAIVKALI